MSEKKYLECYLEYCQYRKELDAKTLKAYRTDLRQFFEACPSYEPGRGEIIWIITDLHNKYKPTNVTRKIEYVQEYDNIL